MSYKNVGKPVTLDQKGIKRLKEILTPEEKPELTLEIYREIQDQQLRRLEPLKQEYDNLLNQLNKLEEIDAVVEYLKLLKQYQEMKQIISSQRNECHSNIREALKQYKCHHPLYAVKNHNAVCVICKQPHQMNRYYQLTPQPWQQLIDDKKLIAGITHYNCPECGDSPIYIPEEIKPFEEVVSIYQNLYDSKEKLKHDGIINENHSLEDLVWEQCTTKQMVKQK